MIAKPSPNVSSFTLKVHALEAQIRLIARDSEKVFFGKHARERLALRELSDRDALMILRIGNIKGDVEAGDEPGEWKCKVVGKQKGTQEIGVITIVQSSGRLFIKTVEWETK